MKLIAAILFLASASAGIWAVDQTVAAMHRAAEVIQSAGER